MTLEEFRILHSTLIEHYQHIEANLEGIYAAISGKKLLDGLKDVEKDTVHQIIKAIKRLEKKKRTEVFSDAEYKYIEDIFVKRNYWCHNCYYDLVFDRKSGGPKHLKDIQEMKDDLQSAKELSDKLFNKKMELFEKHKEQLIIL